MSCAESDFGIFVGAENGLLKGLHLATAEQGFLCKSLASLSSVDGGISCLRWTTEEEQEVLLGTERGGVSLFRIDDREVVNLVESSDQRARLVGLETLPDFDVGDPSALFALSTGQVKVAKSGGQEVIFDAGLKGETRSLCRMRAKSGRLAVGGKGVDLAIIDVEKRQKIFQGKNVCANKRLGLPVPVDITDMRILSGSESVVSCTGCGRIRLHDPRVQRRPVLDFALETKGSLKEDVGFTVLEDVQGNHHRFLVGTRDGDVDVVDLRKKSLERRLLGHQGSVKDLFCHPLLPVVGSVGLDRFMHLHDVNSGRQLSKIYLQTSMRAVLLSKELTEQQLKGHFGKAMGKLTPMKPAEEVLKMKKHRSKSIFNAENEESLMLLKKRRKRS